ncbi:hypothetical protein H920_03425 [Fukomys damarensis]|uniref:Uncharacterized protein n=1 Tax=Fukomys damarensis TaxID=885580 RepID=A0A091EI76_FUKDA|nr:hypothetical protein H920_03425 [Fukomys damarensis]
MGERRFGFLQKLAFLGRGHQYQVLQRDEEETLVSVGDLERGVRLTPLLPQDPAWALRWVPSGPPPQSPLVDTQISFLLLLELPSEPSPCSPSCRPEPKVQRAHLVP